MMSSFNDGCVNRRAHAVVSVFLFISVSTACSFFLSVLHAVAAAAALSAWWSKGLRRREIFFFFLLLIKITHHAFSVGSLDWLMHGRGGL